MIPLYKPFMPELPDLDSILHSTQLSIGNYISEFEETLKKYFEVKYLLITDSFESAINVVIECLGDKSGDEVILSPMGCLASTMPYRMKGLNIVWADIDPERGCLDPDVVRKKITSHTKCIVNNHFCGYPGYIDEINGIGREYNIPVIDDGIECFGSEYKGRLIGNCGTEITVFSFGAIRLPNTIDGGCIIFKDKSLYDRAILLRDCGIDRSIFRDDRGEISRDCDITIPGHSATMINPKAYVGLRQMERIDDLLKKQRNNADNWNKALGKTEFKPVTVIDCNPNYWVYGILAKNKDQAINDFREQGYYASGVHINNDRYSVFGTYEELRGVEDFNSHFVALPCGWWVDEEDIIFNADFCYD